MFKPKAIFWIVSGLAVVIDQWTKVWAMEWLRPRSSVVVIPGFWNWTYVENTGIAFGMMQGFNSGLAVMTVLILGLGWWVARDLDWRQTEVNVLGGMIVAGAFGNWLDRLRHGYVVDFVDWFYQGWHWPVFNVADSLICISIGWILIRQISGIRKATPPR